MFTVIIGAGLGGLSTAYHLEKEGLDYKIYEKDSKPGGLCKSEKVNGFTFDYTGHLLHFKTNYAKGLIFKFLEDNVEEHKRNSWIYSKGVYTRYPFQLNLYGLPPKVVKECLVGYIKSKIKRTKAESFEEWIYSNFGTGIAKHFMIPYNKKLWRYNLKKLTPEWTGRFVPDVKLEEVIEGAISDFKKNIGYNPIFFYPKNGGIESLVKALSSRVKRVNVNKKVTTIDLKNRIVEVSPKEKIHYDRLVSTIPLPELIQIIDPVPAKVKKCANDLKYTSVLNINFGINREKISDKHWIYVPEKDFIFYRIGFPMNFLQDLVPKGKSSIYTEISYKTDVRCQMPDTSRVIEGLLKMGIIKSKREVILKKTFDIKYAYVIYDKSHKGSVELIHNYLNKNKIYSVGRFGKWQYATMEDAILDGKEVVDKMTENSL